MSSEQQNRKSSGYSDPLCGESKTNGTSAAPGSRRHKPPGISKLMLSSSLVVVTSQALALERRQLEFTPDAQETRARAASGERSPANFEPSIHRTNLRMLLSASKQRRSPPTIRPVGFTSHTTSDFSLLRPVVGVTTTTIGCKMTAITFR